MRGNWTGLEHPCFQDYDPEFEWEYVDDDGLVADCDCFDGSECSWKLEEGCSWDNCSYGRLSKWCDWLPERRGPADMPEKMSPNEIPLWNSGESVVCDD